MYWSKVGGLKDPPYPVLPLAFFLCCLFALANIMVSKRPPRQGLRANRGAMCRCAQKPQKSSGADSDRQLDRHKVPTMVCSLTSEAGIGSKRANLRFEKGRR